MKEEILIGMLCDILPEMLNGDFWIDELSENIKKLKDKFPQYDNFYFEDIGYDEVVYRVYGKKKST